MEFDFSQSFKDIAFTFRLTVSILSIGMFITALEDIRSWPVFQSNGILSWRVSKLGTPWFVKSIFSKPLDFLMQDEVYKGFIYVRILFSFLIFILSIFNIMSPVLVSLLFIASLLVSLRSSYGLNGAYQMHIIILLTLSIGISCGIGSPVSSLCLWFIGAQLLLAYFISGITKLASPMWRKSLALKAIFSTRCFGHSLLYKLFSKREVITIIISWSIFCFEISFFSILFSSPTYAMIFIMIGFLFHLSNAIFMGLNDFLFAFSAAYPALMYCVHTLHSS
jgi:hypothetical protein